MSQTVTLELSPDDCLWLSVALCMARAEFSCNGQASQYQELDRLSRELVAAEQEAGVTP